MSGRMFARRLSEMVRADVSGGVVPNTPRYKKIQEMQNVFCRDDGLLVWQKLGRDKVGYYITLGVMLIGFVPSLRTIWKMSFPPAEVAEGEESG